MCWIEYVKLFTGPIGIIVTAIVAIYSIRRTAKEARVSNIHAELITCLSDTLFLIERILNLLNDIGYHRVYRSIPEEQIVETAYDRYWRELGVLSQDFKKLQAKQRLLLPKPLYDKVQEILECINEARKLARNAKPDENFLYPNTTELIKAVENASESLRNIIDESRKHLGTDKLKPVSIVSELSLLKGEYKEKVED